MATFAKISAVLLITATLEGCAGWSCSGWSKIRPSVNDTAGTKSQVLAHNNFGRRQSCWQ